MTSIRWPEDSRKGDVEQLYYACLYVFDQLEERQPTIKRDGQREQVKMHLDTAKEALKREDTETFATEKEVLRKTFRELSRELHEVKRT